MIKTLAIANKSERMRVRVPRSVQQSIPIRRIYTNGIWEVGRKHSRSWLLTDVNYIAASDETQRNIFKSYCAALNSLPTDATAKITIVNHRLNPAEFERRILLPYKDDWLDHYREEANAIMLGRAAQSNNLVQERFVTLSIPQRKISESRAYFRRAGANLQKTFARLDSGITPANNYDRLRISDNQMGYVTNAEPGHGLMKVKGYIIPFDATIPTNGDIYKLINTTPGRG